jgi:flagellin-like hook-associated protein FlgL
MTRPTVLTKTLKMSMARLSSARHINSASADAAGIVIASRLKSEIREKDQAIRNALDGQTLMDTAEGAQKEIENILHRIRGNLVQSASLQVFRTKALTTVAQLMDDIPAGGQARVEPPPQRISTPRSSRWVAKE